MRGAPFTFSNFSGGVSLLEPPYALEAGEARDARNVVASQRGAIRNRDGNATFSAHGSPIESIYAGLAPTLLITHRGTTVETVTTGGVVQTVHTGLTAGLQWEWAKAPASGAMGTYYGLNGAEARYVSAAGLGGAWAVAAGNRFPLWINNRLLICSGAGATNATVAGSKVLDPGVFASPDGWNATLDGGDGLPLTGMGTLQSYVLVFKESKAWLIYDTDTGANRRLGEGVGCVSHRSIAETPKGTFWLARDGVYRTTGQTVEKVSQRIGPLLNTLVQANLGLAAGAYFNDHYYLSVSTAGAGNNLLLDYDLSLGSWWIHTNPASQMSVWRLPTGAQLMGGRPGLSRVDNYFVPGLAADSGVAFNAYWSGPFHAFGSPYLRKRLRRIQMDGKGTVQLSLAKDFAIGPTPIKQLILTAPAAPDTTFGGSGTLGGAGTYFGAPTLYSILEAIVYSLGVARVFGLSFGNDTANAFEIESYTMSITARKN